MIRHIQSLFKRRDRSFEIVLRFTPLADGKYKVRTETGHNVPVSYALDALDKLSWNIKGSLTRKAKIHGLDSNNPKTRAFIKEQRVGDLR